MDALRLALVETSPHGGLLHYAVQMGDALAERGNCVDLLVPRDNELVGRQAGPARMGAVLAGPAASPSEPRPGLAYVARGAGIAARLARAWARAVWEVETRRYDAVLLGDFALSLPALVVLGLAA